MWCRIDGLSCVECKSYFFENKEEGRMVVESIRVNPSAPHKGLTRRLSRVRFSVQPRFRLAPLFPLPQGRNINRSGGESMRVNEKNQVLVRLYVVRLDPSLEFPHWFSWIFRDVPEEIKRNMNFASRISRAKYVSKSTYFLIRWKGYAKMQSFD